MTSPAANDEDQRSIAEYLSPLDAADSLDTERRAGHHAYQVAVDTIAYAQNVPTRLLLKDKLDDVCGSIRKLLNPNQNKNYQKLPAVILLEDTIKIEDQRFLYDEKTFKLGCDWVLSLANKKSDERPDELTKNWEEAMLLLLPHLERDIWFTEISNPLPLHALCRMHEHWSLYIFLWCYKNRNIFDKNENSNNIFDIENLHIHCGETFKIQGKESKHTCIPVIGPIFLIPESDENNYENTNSYSEGNIGDKFISKFITFSDNLKQHWTNNGQLQFNTIELQEALHSRMHLNSDELNHRKNAVCRSLELFRQTHLLPCLFPENEVSKPISRSNWESMAIYCVWLARWEQAFDLFCYKKDGSIGLNNACFESNEGIFNAQSLDIHHHGHRVGFFATLVTSERSTNDRKSVWCIQSYERLDANSKRIVGLDNKLKLLKNKNTSVKTYKAAEFKKSIRDFKDGRNIDLPDVMFNRTRERQRASWTVQVIAINNLLNRHASRSDRLPSDIVHDPLYPDDTPPYILGQKCDEADHLLGGYSARICRHLVSITRGDVADIYWMDYSQSPPRLIHAGGYARMLSHRVNREAIHQSFDTWAWKEGLHPVNNKCPANNRERSESQAYRIAATRLAMPERNSIIYDSSNINENNPVDNKKSLAYFGGYIASCLPEPKDALGVPLLVHGRVVGVLTVAGMNPSQFNERLLEPMRRIASLAAPFMHHHSVLWQMRKLNWLAANRPFPIWKRHDIESKFNPLAPVASCLCNVFLCPLVHIWLQQLDNPQFYQLHGYNYAPIFEPAKGKLKRAPEFKYNTLANIDINNKENKENKEKFSRNVNDAFACLAIDLWKIGASSNTALGKWVRAHWDSEKETEKYNYLDASEEVSILGKNFTDFENTSNAQTHGSARKVIFQEYRFNEMTAFALMQKNATSSGVNSLNVIGVISLHDFGNNDESQSWAKSWNALISHVQTYLPYVLSQVEVLNNPLDNMRRYLMHSARNQLNGVLDKLTSLKPSATKAMGPDNYVRLRLREFAAMPEFVAHKHDVIQIEKMLAKAWGDLHELTTPMFQENLTKTVVAMANYRNQHTVQLEMTLTSENIDLKKLVTKEVNEFSETLKRAGIFYNIDIPNSIVLHMPRQWFMAILSDVIHNAVKYANNKGGFLIEWHGRSLKFSNVGVFDPELDTPERLMSFGGRGSAAKNERTIDTGVKTGKGVGLWGVQAVCDSLGIRHEFLVEPMKTAKDEGLARYIWVFYFDGFLQHKNAIEAEF